MKRIELLLWLNVLFPVSCSDTNGEYYPKPRGLLRMEFPKPQYLFHQYPSCPYRFEIPDYITINTDTSNCHADLVMSRFKATLFLTYLPIDSNELSNYTEQARRLVYDHSIMADGIEEVRLFFPEHKASGIKYLIAGDAASQYQFYLTDSLKHFMRGDLVFYTRPNYDSIKPSLDYITKDLDRMLSTVEWIDSLQE